MILPLPPLYGEIMTACAEGSWQLTEYDGAGFAGIHQFRCMGVVAVRDDLRIQVEWACEAAGQRLFGPWQHRESCIAVRDPGHDPADFGLVTPRRWFMPATKDAHRRLPVPGVYPAVRLLGRGSDALAAVVLARAAR